jgi:hypothetical protein
MCACHGPKQEGVQSAVTAIPQHSPVGANSLTRVPTRGPTRVTTRVGIPAVGWVGGPTRVGSDPLVTTLGRHLAGVNGESVNREIGEALCYWLGLSR